MIPSIEDILAGLASGQYTLDQARHWIQQHFELDGSLAELERRKEDPRTRLHNLCEAIAAEADGSEFSREEWDRIDTENATLRASHQRLKEALTRLMTQFPTDTDMLEAGWENSEVNAACDAYDHAREALRSAP